MRDKQRIFYLLRLLLECGQRWYLFCLLTVVVITAGVGKFWCTRSYVMFDLTVRAVPVCSVTLWVLMARTGVLAFRTISAGILAVHVCVYVYLLPLIV